MAGPGIRSWEFARLLAREHAVTLAAPAPLPPREGSIQSVEATFRSVRNQAAASDVVVMQASALDLFPALEGCPAPLVLDWYDPYIIENLEIHRDQRLEDRMRMHDQDLAVLRRQATVGDFFLCATQRQRHLFIGVLTAMNRVNPVLYRADPNLSNLIAIVPFGVPDEPLRPSGPALRGVVEGIGAADFVLLWGGGIWNWFDPLTLLEAVHRVAGDHPELKLVFMGTVHPNPSVPRQRMTLEAIKLAKRLGLEGRNVFFREGWVPYDERQGFLAEATCGVSLHHQHVETEFAFRTRALDYLWAGLPMIVSGGDAMSELVEREGLGLVATPGDVGGVARAIARMIEDDDFRAGCAKSARGVADAYRWSKVAEPLLEFCRAPARSPDAARREAAANPGLGDRAPRQQVTVARKAWNSLRHDGVGPFARRSYRYLRKRLM
jgi:glycosyltransferase involved in cell wall biosynthesis